MAEKIRAAVEAISCKEGKVKAQIQLGFAEDLSLLVKRLCNMFLQGAIVDASVHAEDDRKRWRRSSSCSILHPSAAIS